MSHTFDIFLAVVTLCIYLGLGVWYLVSSRDRTLRSLQQQLDKLEEEKTIAEQEATIAEQEATIKVLKEEIKCRLEQLLDTEKLNWNGASSS